MLANYGFKLRHIFLPLVALSTAFLATYSILHWLLVLQLHLFDPGSEVRFFLPLVLSGGTVYLGLRHRIGLLRRGSDDRWVTLYYMAPCFMLILGALFITELLTQATGTLTPLSSPSEVSRHEPTQFYTLRKAYAYKQGAGLEVTATPTGKNNSKLRLDVYAACPVLATVADTVTGTASLWLAWKKSKEISANLSNEQKKYLYRKFLVACDSQFKAADLTHYQYLSCVAAADGQVELQTAARRSSFSTGTSAPVIVLPLNEPFAERIYPPLRHLAWTLGIGLVLYLFMLMFPGVATTYGEMWLAGGSKPPLWPQLMPFVLPRPGYFATPLLVGSLLIVYLAMVAAGLGVVNFRSADLWRWGAINGSALQDGAWWRLLSSSFLHGGLMHLLYNATALGLMGWLVEGVAGTARLLFIYFISALGAALFSVWWHPEVSSVGASGAIFGLFGAAIAFSQNQRIPEEDRGGLLLIPLLFGMPSLLIGWFMPSVDNAAHIGGLGIGMLLGAALFPTFPSMYQQYRRR